MGSTVFERLKADLRLTPAATERADAAWAAYTSRLSEQLRLGLAEAARQKREFEDSLEPALARPPADEDAANQEEARVRDLRDRRARGEPLFPQDERYQALRARLAAELTVSLTLAEQAARDQLVSRLQEATVPDADGQALARLPVRLRADGIAGDALEHPPRRQLNPGARYDFDLSGLVRRECGVRGSLGAAGVDCLRLGALSVEATNPLTLKIQQLLWERDEFVASKGDELRAALVAYSRLHLRPQWTDAEERGILNSVNGHARAIIVRNWDTVEEIRSLLLSSVGQSSSEQWESVALSAMFPLEVQPDRVEARMKAAVERAAADTELQARLLQAVEDYCAKRRAIRLQIVRATVEGSYASTGAVTKASQDSLDRLRAEQAALGTRVLDDIRALLGAERAHWLDEDVRGKS